VFLLTNDDGIDADGIAVLERVAAALGPTTTVAPVGAQSGCSHTTTTGRPVRHDIRGPGRFAVHGTPADCVRLALHALCPETTFILSGVNLGGNLGADVWYSGTVAAVREGVLHGIPGIAFSHYKKKHLEYDWPRVERLLPGIIRQIREHPVEAGSFWNVNFPHLEPGTADPEIVICPVDPHPLPLSYREDVDGHYYNGDYHNRARIAGGDVDVCFSGRVAVSRVRLFAS
jgi:5'-nucleotidase